jgi:hypothetical protein
MARDEEKQGLAPDPQDARNNRRYELGPGASHRFPWARLVKTAIESGATARDD